MPNKSERTSNFSRAKFSISVITVMVAIAALAMTWRNSNSDSQNAANRAEQEGATVLLWEKGGFITSNPNVTTSRLNLHFPDDLYEDNVGHVFKTDIGREIGPTLIKIMSFKLARNAEEGYPHSGCLMDVPCLVEYTIHHKGKSRIQTQIYIMRISGDKLTGEWRFFVGEIFLRSTIHGKLTAKSVEQILTLELSKAKIYRTNVTTDGSIPTSTLKQ